MSRRFASVTLTIEVPAYVAEALATLEVRTTYTRLDHEVDRSAAEKSARALVFHWGCALSLVQANEIDGFAAVQVFRALETAGLFPAATSTTGA